MPLKLNIILFYILTSSNKKLKTKVIKIRDLQFSYKNHLYPTSYGKEKILNKILTEHTLKSDGKKKLQSVLDREEKNSVLGEGEEVL
jgi:hypothetical protein